MMEPQMHSNSPSSRKSRSRSRKSRIKRHGKAAVRQLAPLLTESSESSGQECEVLPPLPAEQQHETTRSPVPQERTVISMPIVSPGAGSTGSSSSPNNSNHSRSRIKRYGSASRSPSRETRKHRSSSRSKTRPRSRSRSSSTSRRASSANANAAGRPTDDGAHRANSKRQRSRSRNPATSSSDEDTDMTLSVDEDIDRSGEFPNSAGVPKRSPSTPKYEKYRTFLTRGLSEKEWAEPDAKLGAPPSVEVDTGDETDVTAPMSSDDLSRSARAPLFGGASELGNAANVVSASASSRENSKSGRSKSKSSSSSEGRSISLPESSVLNADDMATISMMLSLDDDDETSQSASVSSRVAKLVSQSPPPTQPQHQTEDVIDEEDLTRESNHTNQSDVMRESHHTYQSSGDDESILARKRQAEQRSTIEPPDDDKSFQVKSVASSPHYTGFISEDEDESDDVRISPASSARHRMMMHASLGSLGYSSESNHPSASVSSSQLLVGTHLVDDDVTETALRLQEALRKVENETDSSNSSYKREQKRRASGTQTATTTAAGISLYTSSTSGSMEEDDTDYSASDAGSVRLAAVAASTGSMAPYEMEGFSTDEDPGLNEPHDRSNRMPDVSSDGSDSESNSSTLFSSIWKQNDAPDVVSTSRRSSNESTASSLVSRTEAERMGEAATLAALAAVKSSGDATPATIKPSTNPQKRGRKKQHAAPVPHAPDTGNRQRAKASATPPPQSAPDAYNDSLASFASSVQEEKEVSMNIFDIAGGGRRGKTALGEEDIDDFSLGASMDIENYGRDRRDLPEYNRKRMDKIDDIETGDNSMSLTAMITAANDPNGSSRSKKSGEEMERLLEDATASLELGGGSSESSGGSGGSGRKPSSKQSSKSKRKKKDQVSIVKNPPFYSGIRRNIIRAIVLLAILAGIIVPVYFILRDDNDARVLDKPLFPPAPTPTAVWTPVDPGLSSAPSVSPTGPPTRSPTPLTLAERLIIAWPQLAESFQDPQTPQSRALAWMLGPNNANVETLSLFRVIQRFVMATFYYSTNGDDWIVNTLWLSDSNECEWHTGSIDGPACNENGELENLELVLNNVGGEIPSELALLSANLLAIDLSRSGSPAAVSGSVPSELGLLTKLELMTLQGNELEGSLPSELGGCSLLEFLDLSENQLTGELPGSLGSFTRLEEIDLKSNQFSGALPTTLGSMTDVRRLDFSQNNFTGAIPSEIGNIFVLELMDMSNNMLSSLPSDIGRMLFLRNINLSNNKIAGTLVTEIGMLPNVLSLNLSSNSMTGAIPTQLGDMFLLRDSLDLSSNQFSGNVPLQIARLIFLRNIRLQSNRLSGPIPPIFTGLTRLNSLRLDDNDLTGVVPDSVCEVFGVTYPLFVTDCPREVECPCCSYCCDDATGECTCQFENTELEFLCDQGDEL